MHFLSQRGSTYNYLSRIVPEIPCHVAGTLSDQPPATSTVISPFTFHLRFAHPLQDVALHHCLPLSSVCCFPVSGGSPFLALSSCHFLHGRPLDLFPLLGCHSVQRLDHILSLLYVRPISTFVSSVYSINVNYLCSFPDL